MKRFIRHLIIFRKQSLPNKYPNTRLQMKYIFKESSDISSLTQLPDGFLEMRYSPGLEYKWLDIINSSGEFGVWDIDLLEKQILNDLVYQGGVLISYGDRCVACAAICERDEFKPNALLMYVIVKQQFRGFGLGKFITVQAVNIARRLRYAGVVLRTDDYRIPAVKMYSQLGFLYDQESGLYTESKWNTLLNYINYQQING
jgi:GNAT superfamily N-acetyltransferase